MKRNKKKGNEIYYVCAYPTLSKAAASACLHNQSGPLPTRVDATGTPTPICLQLTQRKNQVSKKKKHLSTNACIVKRATKNKRKGKRSEITHIR